MTTRHNSTIQLRIQLRGVAKNTDVLKRQVNIDAFTSFVFLYKTGLKDFECLRSCFNMQILRCAATSSSAQRAFISSNLSKISKHLWYRTYDNRLCDANIGVYDNSRRIWC